MQYSFCQTNKYVIIHRLPGLREFFLQVLAVYKLVRLYYRKSFAIST